MSLTSTELNYLVWRYLQESGFDLAAFALEKHSKCLSYEHNKNLPIISRIEPGCLVNLVQKGILFTLAEEDSENNLEKNRYSLLGALVQEELNKQQQEEELSREQHAEEKINERFTLKSEVKELNHDGDVEMKDGDNEETGEVKLDTQETIEFTTESMVPDITYPECLAAHWHPSTDVFAYGKDDSTAVINAIKNNVIAESVTLNHPSALGGSNSGLLRNEITIVSWAPKGNIIVTAGIDGELRAWSPDGKLKNIANTAASVGLETDEMGGLKGNDYEHTPELISSVVWSENGQFVLSIAVNNQVCLWDGNNLNLIQIIKSPIIPTQSSSIIDACWIDEFKFALSTPKNTIKVYQISPPQTNGGQFSLSNPAIQDTLVKPIGFLPGHNNNISILKFSMNSKLLASCSDFDYVIKVWKSSSTQESLELNIPSDHDTGLKYHTSPIIDLFWLTSSDKESFLLSVSMEGIVNMWNATSGEAVISANIFKNEDNFNLLDKSNAKTFAEKKEALIFIATVSPDHKWLAIGDDSGRVSVWDVLPSRYSGKRKDMLRCMGCHELHIPTTENRKQYNASIGICDLAWDHTSLKLSVSYRGLESAIFKWQ